MIWALATHNDHVLYKEVDIPTSQLALAMHSQPSKNQIKEIPILVEVSSIERAMDPIKSVGND